MCQVNYKPAVLEQNFLLQVLVLVLVQSVCFVFGLSSYYLSYEARQGKKAGKTSGLKRG